MILFLHSLCLIIHDFGKKTFNSTVEPSSFQLPYLIFPYYLNHANILNIFNKFQESIKEDPEVATATIDFLKSQTTCSKLSFQPGNFYISFPPHKPKINVKKIETKIETLDSLYQFYNKIKNNNILTFENSVIEDLYRNMTNQGSEEVNPLFVLASKNQNQEDLNEKLDAFKQIALEYIHTNIIFAYTSEPSIYNSFHISPKTKFLYMSPSHKISVLQSSDDQNSQFQFKYEDEKLSNYFSNANDDFSLDDLRKFVENHKIPFLADPCNYKLDESNVVYLTVVGNEQTFRKKELITKLKNIHDDLPVVFINSTEKPFLASAICRNMDNFYPLLKKQFHFDSCLALANFSSKSSIVINQSMIDQNFVFEKVKIFNELYSESITIPQKFYQKIIFKLQFNNNSSIALAACIFSVLIVLNGMIFSCKNERKKKHKVVNTDSEQKHKTE